MYKRDTISEDIITVAGDEYFDNSLPYEGVYINFVNEILKVGVIFVTFHLNLRH
jgi:hypothetical protein